LFNRGPFNRTPFNRPYVPEVFFSISISGSGNLAAVENMNMVFVLSASGIGSLVTNFTHEIYMSYQDHGIGNMNVNFIREKLLSFFNSGKGSMNVDFSRFHLFLIQFTGDLIPGDKIVIDSKKMTISKNGVNVYSQMQGDFFDIQPGQSTLKYTDVESNRTVLLRVQNRDKYLY
jgi:hypothetical protein